MLNNSPIAAVLPAVDLDTEKKFYTHKLGLKLSNLTTKDALIFDTDGGAGLVIYKRDKPTKADHTVAGFMVDNLESAMMELKDKGVVFEDYNLPNIKTVNGIATMDGVKSAWFKDPEGNILALNQM